MPHILRRKPTAFASKTVSVGGAPFYTLGHDHITSAIGAAHVAAHAAGRTREDGDFCSKGIFQDIRDEFGDRIDAALDADTQQTK